MPVSKLGVEPVWNLTNSLASAPVASVFMLTVPLTSVAVTPLTVLIAVAALLAVIGAESVTSVYSAASSVVILIETGYVVDSWPTCVELSITSAACADAVKVFAETVQGADGDGSPSGLVSVG